MKFHPEMKLMIVKICFNRNDLIEPFDFIKVLCPSPKIFAIYLYGDVTRKKNDSLHKNLLAIESCYKVQVFPLPVFYRDRFCTILGLMETQL